VSDWSIQELGTWDEKICEIGRKFGLNWFDIDYEIIDYHEMIGAMSYTGLPTHYRHWSFGKAYERTHTLYNAGMSGLPYEMIINSNPSISYLMAENQMYIHILTMSHCIGHSDFFKNNRMFSNTSPELVIPKFKAAARYVKDLIEDPSIGIDEVEAIIDACHAIKYQIPRYPGIKRYSHNELKQIYADRILHDTDGEYDDFNLNKMPLERDYNLIAFIAEHSRNLSEWQRNLIHIVEESSQYFIPQALTKVMNEGWAVLMHEKIVKELVLPDKYHIPFMKLHNQVIGPSLGRVNPYHLGYNIFKKIEEREGFEACLLAREVHNDITFLRNYLDEEMCHELNLFSYSFKKSQGHTSIDETSDEEGWENVRDSLIKTIGLNSIPVIYVEEMSKDHTLILRHEHDGRDLEMQYSKKVFEYIQNLWGDNVKLFTILENELWEF
jgi:stage V sporulation protein R